MDDSQVGPEEIEDVSGHGYESNENEIVADDEDVSGHGVWQNDNESVVEDEDVSGHGSKIALNENETLSEDDADDETVVDDADGPSADSA